MTLEEAKEVIGSLDDRDQIRLHTWMLRRLDAKTTRKRMEFIVKISSLVDENGDDLFDQDWLISQFLKI